MYRIPLENEQITKALTTPFAPVDFTDEEKEQIRENIGAGTGSGGGGRNLLDNGWFTVNQRNASSFSLNAYGVDRWIGSAEILTNSINADHSITITSSAKGRGIGQFWESGLIEGGKVYTISVLINGVIHSKSFTAIADNSWHTIEIDNIVSCVYTLRTNGNPQGITIGATTPNTPITIKAVKLELGEQSTLANDAPPNYATELLKCQRYFVRFMPFASNFLVMGMGMAKTNTYCDIVVLLPTRMRTSPTLGYGTLSSIQLGIGATLKNPSAMVIDIANPMLCAVRFTASGLTAGSAYQVMIYNDGNNYIDFIADL